VLNSSESFLTLGALLLFFFFSYPKREPVVDGCGKVEQQQQNRKKKIF
jgi:hypothetical protein